MEESYQVKVEEKMKELSKSPVADEDFYYRTMNLCGAISTVCGDVLDKRISFYVA